MGSPARRGDAFSGQLSGSAAAFFKNPSRSDQGLLGCEGAFFVSWPTSAIGIAPKPNGPKDLMLRAKGDTAISASRSMHARNAATLVLHMKRTTIVMFRPTSDLSNWCHVCGLGENRITNDALAKLVRDTVQV
jgi:hypothetical protein